MAILTLADGLPLQTPHEQKDIVWLDAACTENIRMFGAAETQPRYRRLPQWLEPTLRQELVELGRQSSGIRARFRTNSPYIALRVQWDAAYLNSVSWHGMRSFDLYSVHGGHQAFEHFFKPPVQHAEYLDDCYMTPGDLREYLLNWPLYNKVFKVYIGLQAGSVLEAGGGYHNDLPVVFYGSSITQGAFASRPGNSYQNFLSRALDMDYINLGFSGNGRGDPVLVDYMATIPMACFVSDYDHNAPDEAHLEKTHFDVYRRIREKNPDLPYIMITKPDYRPTDCVRRSIVMESYQKALAAGDKNVYFVDGAAFFAGVERDACTFDGVHPNDLGLYRMAEGMVHVLRRILYGGGLY